jgi:hypothetical protein
MDAMTSPRQENVENGHDEDNEPAQPTPKKRKAPAAKAKSATKPRADGATKATKGRKAPVTKVPVDGEVVDENDEQGQLDTIKQEYTNDTVAKMDECKSATFYAPNFRSLRWCVNKGIDSWLNGVED